MRARSIQEGVISHSAISAALRPGLDIAVLKIQRGYIPDIESDSVDADSYVLSVAGNLGMIDAESVWQRDLTLRPPATAHLSRLRVIPAATALLVVDNHEWTFAERAAPGRNHDAAVIVRSRRVITRLFRTRYQRRHRVTGRGIKQRRYLVCGEAIGRDR